MSPARTTRGAALAAAALLCAACPQKSAVWVADGSTAERLVFRMGRERGGSEPAEVGVVRVYGCDAPAAGDGAMWVVGPKDGTAPLREIVYGQTPPNAVTDQGPRPLTPGCYHVAVSGTGRATFDVLADGRVVERAGR